MLVVIKYRSSWNDGSGVQIKHTHTLYTHTYLHDTHTTVICEIMYIISYIKHKCTQTYPSGFTLATLLRVP